MYGDNVITDVDVAPEHVNDSGNGMQAKIKAMKSAAADIMLFSLAHVHVITMSSGFGQKAAFLSDSSNKIHVYFGSDGESCSLIKYSANAAVYWSGV